MSTSASGADVAPATPAAAPPASAERTAQRERLRLLLRSKTFIAGAVIVGIFVIFAIFGETLAPEDPFATDPLDDLAAPSGEHLFGTDRVGRDVLSRVIVGARDILIVAPAATLLGTVVGTALGLVTGYFRGPVDDILSRFIDAFLALPTVIIGILAIVALGPSKWTVIFVIGLVFAPIIARTVRAAVLQEREMEYVAAAQLRNERAPYILFAEILPNVMGPIIVEFTVRLGYAVFTMAGLAFIGFGSQPGSPDWGRTVNDERVSLLSDVWWPSMFPALGLATLVVAINLVADAVQGVVDR